MIVMLGTNMSCLATLHSGDRGRRQAGSPGAGRDRPRVGPSRHVCINGRLYRHLRTLHAVVNKFIRSP